MKAQSYAILAVLGIIGVAVIVYYKQITALFSGVSQGVTNVKNALVNGIGVPVTSTIAKGLGLKVTGTSNGIVQVSKTTTSTSNPSNGTAMIMVGNVTQANVPAGNLDHNGNTYSFSQLANDPAILGSLQSSFSRHTIQRQIHTGLLSFPAEWYQFLSAMSYRHRREQLIIQMEK